MSCLGLEFTCYGVVMRKVLCKKYGKELDGLEKAPFSGPIGQQIFDSISKQAWDEWKNDVQIKILNEYRLNMANPEDYKTLVNQMLRFLNLETGQVAEVENADRGRGN